MAVIRKVALLLEQLFFLVEVVVERLLFLLLVGLGDIEVFPDITTPNPLLIIAVVGAF